MRESIAHSNQLELRHFWSWREREFHIADSSFPLAGEWKETYTNLDRVLEQIGARLESCICACSAGCGPSESCTFLTIQSINQTNKLSFGPAGR